MDSSINKSESDAFTDTSFDDIRPLNDTEVKDAIDFLLNDKWFKIIVEPLIAPITWGDFSEEMRSCEKIIDFQKNVIYTIIYKFIAGNVEELDLLNPRNIDLNQSHMYISNHRDIVLDAGLFNIILHGKGYDTTEVAIGDNLLIYPWITTLVRLNKSFIVKRNIPVREVLAASEHLSKYIHKTINKEKQSIWIAQREGRAKDSNDRTQTSLLKMLTLVNRNQPIESLKALDMIPLSISYEYDPCDFLKAKEFQLKRDNPDHKKSQADDIENMYTGMVEFKGRVHFKLGNPINPQLIDIPSEIERGEMLQTVADIIDKEIYTNYTFYPINYVAYDLMTDSNSFTSQYNEDDKSKFELYLNTQLAKIDIPEKDEDFLRMKIIEMYGNTVKSYLKVKKT
jgi:hypothetical protein